jgi:folate-binding Fe-S cluster repair protein YgfZ
VLFCALLRLPQGKDSIKFLEGLVTGDIAGLADGTGSLSVFTNEKGGIIDDTVITKVGGGAPCRDQRAQPCQAHQHLMERECLYSKRLGSQGRWASVLCIWCSGGANGSWARYLGVTLTSAPVHALAPA